MTRSNPAARSERTREAWWWSNLRRGSSRDSRSTNARPLGRERQLEVMSRLGLKAPQEKDLQTFMNAAVHEIQQTLGTDLCLILELQPGGEALVPRAGVGWRDEWRDPAPVSVAADSHSALTLASEQPVVVDDLRNETQLSASPLLSEHGDRQQPRLRHPRGGRRLRRAWCTPGQQTSFSARR